jgi:flavin-binding protein dodecin
MGRAAAVVTTKHRDGVAMAGHVYKSIEITGSSTADTTDAIRVALAKASETIRNVEWFEVVSTRGYVADDVTYFQVTVKIGFRLE